MSDNGKPEQESIQLTCAKCKQVFSIPEPPIEVFDGALTSTITALHPRLVRCIGCKEFLLLGIQSVKIQWGYRYAPPELIARMGTPLKEPSAIIQATPAEVLGLTK